MKNHLILLLVLLLAVSTRANPDAGVAEYTDNQPGDINESGVNWWYVAWAGVGGVALYLARNHLHRIPQIGAPLVLGAYRAPKTDVKKNAASESTNHRIVDAMLSAGESTLDFIYEWRWPIGTTLAAIAMGGVAVNGLPRAAVPAAPIVPIPQVVAGIGTFVEANCPICREVMGVATSFMPCGHTFHTDCITQWLGIGTVCPSCRAH